MDSGLAIVITEHAYIRSSAEQEDGRNVSGIEDEIFSGWAVRILDEAEGKAYVKVETHYGYTGYVNRKELHRISKEELQHRQDKEKFYRIRISEADLLDQPKVQGLPLELLLKNCIVELIEQEVVEGWSRVRTASGKEGYLHTENLKKRRDSDEYLLLDEASDREKYFQKWKNPYSGEKDGEAILREMLTASAREFLGIQYRWGGKSSQGIDCSGLVFMSYLDQGIVIYRDADIREGYPVKEISKENLKKGDLIFFPGHVAMYLGENKYIHATGYVKTPYVTVNSLKETDPDYREDLADKITECGSIFA